MFYQAQIDTLEPMPWGFLPIETAAAPATRATFILPGRLKLKRRTYQVVHVVDGNISSNVCKPINESLYKPPPASSHPVQELKKAIRAKTVESYRIRQT